MDGTHSKAPTRQEILPRDAFQPGGQGPIRCPHCAAKGYRGQNLTVYGNIQEAHTEIWVEDETQPEGFRILNQVTDESALWHEIEMIDCQRCHIRFVIQTKENFELTRQNQDLAERLLRHEDIPGMGRPC